MKNDLTIIGSGLTGPLLSTILSKKCNLNINMFERSADSRLLNDFSGRSINLALSKRGINDTTMSNVSQGAGLSQGLINFHFKSKESSSLISSIL